MIWHRSLFAGLAVLVVLPLAPGCGQSGGCLSRAEVQREVNELAMGFEMSPDEVEAKQGEIQVIREREC